MIKDNHVQVKNIPPATVEPTPSPKPVTTLFTERPTSSAPIADVAFMTPLPIAPETEVIPSLIPIVAFFSTKFADFPDKLPAVRKTSPAT